MNFDGCAVVLVVVSSSIKSMFILCKEPVKPVFVSSGSTGTGAGCCGNRPASRILSNTAVAMASIDGATGASRITTCVSACSTTEGPVTVAVACLRLGGGVLCNFAR